MSRADFTWMTRASTVTTAARRPLRSSRATMRPAIVTSSASHELRRKSRWPKKAAWRARQTRSAMAGPWCRFRKLETAKVGREYRAAGSGAVAFCGGGESGGHRTYRAYATYRTYEPLLTLLAVEFGGRLPNVVSLMNTGSSPNRLRWHLPGRLLSGDARAGARSCR